MNDKKIRILLVEDNATDVLLLEAALEEVHFPPMEVTHAARLGQALQLLSERHFDVVLSDLGLPDSQGLETFRKLFGSHPNVPILVLTGLNDEATGLSAIQAGAQDYLVKGHMSGQALARVIHYAIERRKTAERLQTSEMRYRRLFEAAHDGILILDVETRKITEANPYMTALLEYSRDEFLGRELWELGLFQDEQASAEAFRELQQNGYIRYDDLPLKTKSGRSAFVEFVSNVYEEDGRQVVQCNIRDISERKRAEMAERESQRFLQSTLDALSSHIAVLDETGTIITVNKAWQQFAEENDGAAISCGVGSNYLEVCSRASGIWAGDAPLVMQGIRDVIVSQHADFCLEYPCHSPTEQRWFNVCVTRFAGDGPVHVAVAHENVSQRKLAESTLHQERDFISAVVETVGSLVVVLDRHGHIIRFNRACEQLTGYSFDEVKNRPFWEFFLAPEEAEDVKAEFDELRSGLFPNTHENHWVTKSGERRLIAWSNTALVDAQGAVEYIIGTGTDITERQQAEAAQAQLTLELQQQRQRLDDILTNMPAIVWEADSRPNGLQQLDYASKYVETMLGYSVEEWLATPNFWLSIVHPDDQERVTETASRELAVGQGGARQYRMICKDGRVVWVETHTEVIRDAPGNIIGLRGVTLDISPRKQAEQELQDSQARFESIVANVPGVVYQYILHPDGSVQIPFVNEACRELFEMEPEEIQRSPNFPAEIIHPDDRAASERSVAASAANLTPWNWEGRFRLPSGEIKWVQGAAQPRRLPDGGTFWDGLLMDITARKAAEEERDRFFTLSLDMLAIIGSDGYFKRMNPAFEETLGHSEAEMMAVPFLEFVHPDDIVATLEQVSKIKSGSKVMLFENRYRCRDGSYKWMRWMCAPFEELWYCVAHDTTERKQAEEILQASENLYRYLADAMPQLVWSTDENGSHFYFNQRWYEYTGFSKEESLGFGFADALHPDDKERTLERWQRAWRNGEGYEIEYRFYSRPRNEYRWFLGRAVPVRDASGKITQWAGTCTDIEKQKRDEEALQKAQEELEERVLLRTKQFMEAKEESDAANLAKSEFLSRMSHELRTPLNAILGFGQILEMRGGDAKQLGNIQQILKAGRHLLSLINEVLDITRIEAGHMSLSLEPIHAGIVVQESLDLVRPLANARQIELVNQVVGEDAARHLLADQQRLKQVLLNLLSNAVKYNSEGGSVFVGCQITTSPGLRDGIQHKGLPEGRVRFSVRDTGAGLSPQDIAKLFVPFERLAAARSQIEGTGIGLTLSKRLVGAMNGQMGVTSEEGQGSTFWVELPLVSSPLEQVGKVAATLDPVAASSLESLGTVLYIEDNLSNISLVESALSEQEYQVRLLTAMQGSVGLELAAQHHPDLILLDVHLPDIMGDVVLHRLKEDAATRDIPVVVLSADATPSQVERLMAGGAEAYLTKPLDLKQFFSVLEEVLKRDG